MIYLTGVHNPVYEELAKESRHFGLMVTQSTKRRLYALEHIPKYHHFAIDNDCFRNPHKFNLESYMDFLQLVKDNNDTSKCLFVTAPDVVGDAEATLRSSLPVIQAIRDMGYRVAFIAQDGATELSIPWEEIDVLFIGGTNEFKLGPGAKGVAEIATCKGKWVHNGRVNSWKRIQYSIDIGCNSSDGTIIRFGPDYWYPSIRKWLKKLESREE